MSKILYAAGTLAHIKSFHLPYIDALRAEGHEVKIMAHGDGADYNIPFEKKMLSLRNFSCQRQIKRVLREESFDTVILNTTLAAFNIRMALPSKNRPRVINFVHGYMFPKEPDSLKNKIFLLAERYLAPKTDAILVMNGEDLEITERYKLCRGEVKMTLGMGAEAAECRATADEVFSALGCPRDSYVMSFVGELSRAKNQKMLIEALPKIREHIPNAVLWLVGEGSAREELAEAAEALSVSKFVYFAGRRDNPCDFIRASDIYISPSLKEGLPFNVIEALGCRKTVLASRIKGHRDLICDGESGFLFDAHGLDVLVSLVCRAHDGDITLDADKIHERYLLYSYDNVFPKTYQALKELLENER